MTIQITCYRQTKTYPESARKSLMDSYFEGMMFCEGSEQERYTNVYIGLKMGANIISDDGKYSYTTQKKTVKKTTKKKSAPFGL